MPARSAEAEFRRALAWIVFILIAGGGGVWLLLASIASCVTT
jgi:hypothetical protein